MSFASDRLYNGYLRRNMPAIVSRVKVREIIPHLPCLTDHDKENIEAKRETYGNYDGMVLLLDCLKRRENWPEQFIQALQACEHTTLAAEIRQEYDSLRGVNNSSPASAPAAVVRAHVHPPPAASHLPGSTAGVVGQAAAAQPTEPPPAPREPAAQAPPPIQTPAQQQVPQMAAAQASGAVSPPEPGPQPPLLAEDDVPLLPSTPPPSPEIQRAQAAETPPPQGEDTPHREPEENSESDTRDASVETSLVPEKMSPGKPEAAVSVATSPQPQQVVPHSDTETLLRTDPLQTAVATDYAPQQSPSLTPMNSDVSDGSSFLTLTPEKHPVQDTTPPVHKVAAAVLQPQKSPEPSAAPIVKSRTQPEAAGSTSPESCTEDGDDNAPCMSKPGQLISIQPDNRASPAVPSFSSPLQPYSGNSERLEISEAASDAESNLPACTALSPKAEDAASAPPCQENGIAADHSEPEENHYESPNQSFEVRENVVHVTGLPSLLNLDGQVLVPQLQIISEEPANGSFSASAASFTAVDDTGSSLNGPHSESYKHSESAGGGPSTEQKPPPHSEESNDPNCDVHSKTTYVLIAAGVAACALLIGMRLKK
ncbi:mitochondrial antiviral-signaling protein [Fundulus heteroclitus]|uniref:mitochondrial antiviral-signaling protein n=1 Tax=Fundulus heteroclitus TaxID=8078 RepID=UPI00165CB58B|nr:mitochondrial antiviral-signaling protein [Fundulus heteroclitus]